MVRLVHFTNGEWLVAGDENGEEENVAENGRGRQGIGTLLAAPLAYLIEYIANKLGKVLHAVFVGAAVCLIGVAATYLRFFPCIKKNYDHGVVMFLATFSLIMVSSFREESVLKIAKDQFFTFSVGCAICFFIILLVFPIWSGENLHNSIVQKLEGLTKSVEGCVNVYFNGSEMKDNKEKSNALYASWEPRNLRRCCRSPWKQYMKVGAVLREFGLTLIALHGCLQTEVQVSQSVSVMFIDPCIRLAGEITKALAELAKSIRDGRRCSPDSDQLHKAMEDVSTILKSLPRLFLGFNNNHAKRISRQTKHRRSRSAPEAEENNRRDLRPQTSKITVANLEFSEASHFASFASLLVEIGARLDNVIKEVQELGRIASYKKHDPERDEIV
ncbi:hypothetical protein V6N12_061984 [Hibiscus sabdariffa]|uniref:Uncharacterized protein n=1 Tax=Hibiscus sabdariffa TaxID=183260 RepID=A0ABR2DYM6_9ROSI